MKKLNTYFDRIRLWIDLKFNLVTPRSIIILIFMFASFFLVFVFIFATKVDTSVDMSPPILPESGW